jgi:hypothetical protein
VIPMNSVADNVWAFLLVVLGAAMAVVAAKLNNRDLLAFGSTVAGYGAATFQSNKGKHANE